IPPAAMVNGTAARGHSIMTGTQWFAAPSGKQEGPFSEAQMLAMIAAGQVTRETLVWTAGMSDWRKAGEVPQLMSAPLALASSTPGPSDRLLTIARTWPLFGRALLLMLGQVLVIPSPWTSTAFYRWFASTLVLPNRKTLLFTGR